LSKIGQENASQIFKIAAYITVFYEKKPSKTVKVGNNFSWEIADAETQAKYTNNKINDKNIDNMNMEYIVLMLISICGIGFFAIMCGLYSNLKEGSNLILFSICLLYVLISLPLFCKTIKDSWKNACETRVRHLNDFLRYSVDTGHYTEEEIKERFGDFLDKLK
jgi:hypothetical protein